MATPTKSKIALELHKPARRIYSRRRVISYGKDDLWQADLVEMIPYSKMNRGFKYLLTVIDVYSKYAFAEPVLNKSASQVTSAFQRILRKAKRQPNLLQTDHGKEFYNKDFSAALNKVGIRHYSTYSTMKASVVERFNRTLKSHMWREFTARGTYRWIDMLQDLVTTYNNTVHRTIGTMPSKVIENTPRLNRLHRGLKIADLKRHRFRVGDHVRISKQKSVFAKGYTPNWSTEIFRIVKVKLTNPVTYLLQDLNKQPIEGGFYAEEMQKTRFPHDYLIEKVIRKKANKLFVKWLGFDSTHNSWINVTDILSK